MDLYVFDKDNKMVKINLKDVQSIERWNRETMFRIGAHHYCPPSTLAELNEVYNQFDFYQIDRKTLINLRKVERVQSPNFYIGHHAYKVSKRKELGIRDEFDKFL